MTNSYTEGTDVFVTFAFVDEDGAASAPTTLDIQVVCLSSGTELLAWASQTPATPFEYRVPATLNGMQDADAVVEVKQVLARVNDGITGAAIHKQEYFITNESV